MSHRKKDSLLWRIGSNEHTSYLFGTMHVRDQIAYNFLDPIIPYISSCDRYFGEMNLDEASELSRPNDLLMPNGMTIHQLLGKRKFQKAARIIRKTTGLELSAMNRVYPLVVTNMVSEQMLQSDHNVPLDMHLWQLAASQDKEMGGLESYFEQQNTLKSIDLYAQSQQFNQMWRRIGSFRRHLDTLVQLYANQQIHKLYKISAAGMGRMKEPMIITRNINMANKIESGLPSSTFYAVGAGHLGGAYGLIHLLKGRNIDCVPITLRP